MIFMNAIGFGDIEDDYESVVECLREMEPGIEAFGQIDLLKPIHGASEEDVIAKLEMYAAPDFFVNRELLQEWVVYQDQINNRIWVMSPVKMALLFKRYDLCEALLDKGFNVDIKKKSEVQKDYVISESSGINQSEYKRITLYTFILSAEYGDITDELMKRLLDCSEYDDDACGTIIRDCRTIFGTINAKRIVPIYEYTRDENYRMTLNVFSNYVDVNVVNPQYGCLFGTEIKPMTKKEIRKIELAGHVRLQTQYDFVKYYLAIGAEEPLSDYLLTLGINNTDILLDGRYNIVNSQTGVKQYKRIITYRKAMCKLLDKNVKAYKSMFVLMLSDLASLSWLINRIDEAIAIDSQNQNCDTQELLNLYEDYKNYVFANIPTNATEKEILKVFQRVGNNIGMNWSWNYSFEFSYKEQQILKLLSEIFGRKLELKMTVMNLKMIETWLFEIHQLDVEVGSINPVGDILATKNHKKYVYNESIDLLGKALERIRFSGDPLKYIYGRRHIDGIANWLVELDEIDLTNTCINSGLVQGGIFDVVFDRAFMLGKISQVPYLIAVRENGENA